MSYETAIHQWQDGERRLAEAEPAQARALERVVQGIVDELRRRLGGAFTAVELAELYDGGTDWCLDLYMTAFPDPVGWDPQAVTDAAFARYVREARDFAGGRRVEDPA